jgi:hypothetical protein
MCLCVDATCCIGFLGCGACCTTPLRTQVSVWAISSIALRSGAACVLCVWGVHAHNRTAGQNSLILCCRRRGNGFSALPLLCGATYLRVSLRVVWRLQQGAHHILRAGESRAAVILQALSGWIAVVFAATESVAPDIDMCLECGIFSSLPAR